MRALGRVLTNYVTLRGLKLVSSGLWYTGNYSSRLKHRNREATRLQAYRATTWSSAIHFVDVDHLFAIHKASGCFGCYRMFLYTACPDPLIQYPRFSGARKNWKIKEINGS
jgi:hypothetical protein